MDRDGHDIRACAHNHHGGPSMGMPRVPRSDGSRSSTRAPPWKPTMERGKSMGPETTLQQMLGSARLGSGPS